MPRYDFRTPRLFLDEPLEAGRSLELSRAQANYLGNVLRLTDGAPVLVCNGRDGEWQAKLRTVRKTAVLDVLEQALYDRQPGQTDALVHHSDRGSQYASIRYTQPLAEAGIQPSVGSRGDSYDNALAETINGLYKAELIHRHAPWKTKESVELATLQWVHWFNHIRLLEPIGYILPAEAEANYWRQLAETTETATST
jgi:transposase InsO family protein